MNHWDLRFLGLAEHVASWSRDPSTKVGCVIVRPNKTIASLGFNGLPRDVVDTDERLTNREVKYEMIVHAEMNAILHSAEPLDGYTLYVVPFPPCSRCAAAIIQKRIKRVVFGGEVPERWRENVNLSARMFGEAAVTIEGVMKWK